MDRVHRRRAKGAIGALIVLAAIATSCSPAPGRIQGVVRLGPRCSAGAAPCPVGAPVAADVEVHSEARDATERTRSGSDGRFEYSTSPGTYDLTARTPAAQRCAAVTVEVRSGATVEATLRCDST